jgi:hypothetical protein
MAGILQSDPQCELGASRLYMNPRKNKGAGARLRKEYNIRIEYLPSVIRSEPESESAKRTAQKADFQWVIRVVNSAHDLAALLFNRARSSVLVLWNRNGSSVIKKSCANFFDLGFILRLSVCSW